jgi:hypothetical protein
MLKVAIFAKEKHLHSVLEVVPVHSPQTDGASMKFLSKTFRIRYWSDVIEDMAGETLLRLLREWYEEKCLFFVKTDNNLLTRHILDRIFHQLAIHVGLFADFVEMNVHYDNVKWEFEAQRNGNWKERESSAEDVCSRP